MALGGRKSRVGETAKVINENETEWEHRLLAWVRRPDYRPVKARAIARQWNLPNHQWREVSQAVKRLVSRGKLAYGRGRVVQAPEAVTPKERRIVGVFRRAGAGFGFVRPSLPAEKDLLVSDIFIPAAKTGDASTGDVVAVRLIRQGGRPLPGPRGEILEVLQRQTRRFVGTYFEYRGAGTVQIDGPVFTKPIIVGDAGARGVQPNDKVVVEMIRFPTPWQRGEGVIVEVLGPRAKPGVDTLSILREFDLPGEFPEEALAEARRQAERFDESVPADRLDATQETVVTIDPADARDFDDAISLVRLENGHWRLGVHIADVAHFVRPRSALDREAYHRATSVYLPDRVIPMLPELISNGLASLQPRKIRWTKSVYMDFTSTGVRVGAEVHRAAIRSRKRLTYEQVDQFFADPKQGRRKLGAEVCDLLERMRQLAALLRQRRMARGALELVMPEVRVLLDKQGRVSGAQVIENTESHQIIEEFMVAANEAVAEMLQDRGWPFLRRIHQAPAPHKLRDLAAFVAELGLPHEDLGSRPGLQQLLHRVLGRPEQHAVHYAVLRSLPRAIYSPVEEGHYALASTCYCHFTSPIRRYPDLTVHRLIDAMLDRTKPPSDPGALVLIGEHCSAREQRAEAAERELVKLKLLAYLTQRIGEQMDAVVTGVESFGLFAQGIDLPAEGLIHVEALADDYYRFDRTTHTLTGRRPGNVFRLGDWVRVEVAHVDLERRELDFRLVARKPHRHPAPSAPTLRSASPSAQPKRSRARRTRESRHPPL